MDDKTKPMTGNWEEAARKSEKSWDKEADKHRDAPEQSIEESMERTEEGYGSGKDGADPRRDDDGTTPSKPAG
ncbi:hypothetical protein [Roseomonas sp. WA12]